MREVIRYEACDGSVWASEFDAMARERMLAEIRRLESLVPALPKDDGCEFANGHGWIQHHAVTFAQFRSGLLDLIASRCSAVRERREDLEAAHPDWVARFYDVNDPLSVAWKRVLSTDHTTLREYGQPYFAINPGQAKGRRINE